MSYAPKEFIIEVLGESADLFDFKEINEKSMGELETIEKNLELKEIKEKTKTVRPLSLNEMSYASRLGYHCVTDTNNWQQYSNQAYVSYTITHPNLFSEGSVIVLLGSAKNKDGAEHSVGMIEQIDNIAIDQIAIVIQSIQLSLDKKGYALLLPKDFKKGSSNSLSNDGNVLEHVQKSSYYKESQQTWNDFKPISHTSDFKHPNTRLYENMTGKEVVKIDLGEKIILKLLPLTPPKKQDVTIEKIKSELARTRKTLSDNDTKQYFTILNALVRNIMKEEESIAIELLEKLDFKEYSEKTRSTMVRYAHRLFKNKQEIPMEQLIKRGFKEFQENNNPSILSAITQHYANQTQGNNEDAYLQNLIFKYSEKFIQVRNLKIGKTWINRITNADVNKEIILASISGDISWVQECEQNPNLTSAGVNEAIQVAADNNHLEMVKHLAQNEKLTSDGVNGAIRWAARNNHLEVVKHLAQNEKLTSDGVNGAIQVAADNNHLEMVKHLEQNPKLTSTGVNRAIRWAANNNHLEVVKHLAQVKIKVLERESKNRSTGPSGTLSLGGLEGLVGKDNASKVLINGNQSPIENLRRLKRALMDAYKQGAQSVDVSNIKSQIETAFNQACAQSSAFRREAFMELKASAGPTVSAMPIEALKFFAAITLSKMVILSFDNQVNMQTYGELLSEFLSGVPHFVLFSTVAGVTTPTVGALAERLILNKLYSAEGKMAMDIVRETWKSQGIMGSMLEASSLNSFVKKQFGMLAAFMVTDMIVNLTLPSESRKPFSDILKGACRTQLEFAAADVMVSKVFRGSIGAARLFGIMEERKLFETLKFLNKGTKAFNLSPMGIFKMAAEFVIVDRIEHVLMPAMALADAKGPMYQDYLSYLNTVHGKPELNQPMHVDVCAKIPQDKKLECKLAQFAQAVDAAKRHMAYPQLTEIFVKALDEQKNLEAVLGAKPLQSRDSKIKTAKAIDAHLESDLTQGLNKIWKDYETKQTQTIAKVIKSIDPVYENEIKSWTAPLGDCSPKSISLEECATQIENQWINMQTSRADFLNRIKADVENETQVYNNYKNGIITKHVDFEDSGVNQYIKTQLMMFVQSENQKTENKNILKLQLKIKESLISLVNGLDPIEMQNTQIPLKKWEYAYKSNLFADHQNKQPDELENFGLNQDNTGEIQAKNIQTNLSNLNKTNLGKITLSIQDPNPYNPAFALKKSMAYYAKCIHQSTNNILDGFLKNERRYESEKTYQRQPIPKTSTDAKQKPEVILQLFNTSHVGVDQQSIMVPVETWGISSNELEHIGASLTCTNEMNESTINQMQWSNGS